MADLGLDGLASGIPTQEMINQLMEIERKPIINMQREKLSLEESKNAWRDVNSRLDKLEDKLTQLKLSSTFTSRTTSSSNEDVATATAATDASTGTYDITVNDVAQNQRVSGDQLLSSDTAFQDEFASFPTSSNVTINGQSMEITETDTLKTVRDNINNNIDGADASIVDNHLVLESSETGLENQLGVIDDNNVMQKLGIFVNGADDSTLTSATQDVADASTALGLEGSFDINVEGGGSATISLTTDDTLNTFKDKINNSGLANTSATVNGTSLEINNSNGNAVKMENPAGTDNIIQEMRFGSQSFSNELQAASDAKIEINGITGITSSDNTFSDAVDGVTFNIDSGAQIDDTATITVSKDTEKATSAVQEFVDQYNSVMDFMDTKLDYDAETKEAGTLQGDSTLMRLQMRVRSMVTERVNTDSSYSNLSTVGIEVDREGKMSFDSGEMAEAIENSPEDVKNLFNAESSEEGFDGVATKVDGYLDQMLQSTSGTIPRRIDFYDTRMDNIDENIADMQRRLESTRQRYEEQFTAMETAMSEMQQQQSWMQQQLASLGNTSSLISSMT